MGRGTARRCGWEVRGELVEDCPVPHRDWENLLQRPAYFLIFFYLEKDPPTIDQCLCKKLLSLVYVLGADRLHE